MKKFLKEFKEFALKGNVLDLAIGVIIGAAFKDIVTSLTDNFINPILQLITAGDKIEMAEVGVYASNFITAVINFIIMAFILFVMVKAINPASAGEEFRKAPEELAWGLAFPEATRAGP